MPACAPGLPGHGGGSAAFFGLVFGVGEDVFESGQSAPAEAVGGESAELGDVGGDGWRSGPGDEIDEVAAAVLGEGEEVLVQGEEVVEEVTILGGGDGGELRRESDLERYRNDWYLQGFLNGF